MSHSQKWITVISVAVFQADYKVNTVQTNRGQSKKKLYWTAVLDEKRIYV